MTFKVAIFVYPGFELLDASGPASVLESANHVLALRAMEPLYETVLVSVRGGLVASNGGVQVHTEALTDGPPGQLHTFLVTGAEEPSLRAIMATPELRTWVPIWARSAVRYGSICSGTFVLAAAGLIDGRRVACHWIACRPLASAYPQLSVDENAIYVEDGDVWTSAGVSTGIDMALAMVAKDASASIANVVARRLVLYARRPGYQSQFSAMLLAQGTADNPFVEVLEWMHDNLDRDLGVPALADRAGLTERTFYRKFTSVMGETPARFVELLRLDEARLLLSRGVSVKAAAARVGLSPSGNLSRCFERRFGISPTVFREMHRGHDAEGGGPADTRLAAAS
jgi:transcriptional regulator GlxA family with amidase domain